MICRSRIYKPMNYLTSTLIFLNTFTYSWKGNMFFFFIWWTIFRFISLFAKLVFRSCMSFLPTVMTFTLFDISRRSWFVAVFFFFLSRRKQQNWEIRFCCVFLFISWLNSFPLTKFNVNFSASTDSKAVTIAS